MKHSSWVKPNLSGKNKLGFDGRQIGRRAENKGQKTGLDQAMLLSPSHQDKCVPQAIVKQLSVVCTALTLAVHKTDTL